MTISERKSLKASAATFPTAEPGAVPPLPIGTPPLTPDVRLTRAQTAAALTLMGFPVAAGTLSTKATRGGGPPYQSFGRVPLYRWGDALEWAQSRLTPVRRSTSEHRSQQAA